MSEPCVEETRIGANFGKNSLGDQEQEYLGDSMDEGKK